MHSTLKGCHGEHLKVHLTYAMTCRGQPTWIFHLAILIVRYFSTNSQMGRCRAVGRGAVACKDAESPHKPQFGATNHTTLRRRWISFHVLLATSPANCWWCFEECYPCCLPREWSGDYPQYLGKSCEIMTSRNASTSNIHCIPPKPRIVKKLIPSWLPQMSA